MNLLVTGAGGFLGRALVRAVLARDPGNRVLGVDPAPAPPDLDGRLAWESERAADGARIEQLLRSHSVDAVAHLARGADAPDIGSQMRSHLGGTLTLLHAVARVGGVRRVLVPGSAAEYGLFSEAELPIPEDRVPRPASPYGYAKLAETQLSLMAGAKLGVPALVARVFNPVGPGQSARFVCGSLARQFARMRAAGALLPLALGAGTPIRDFVDVADVAEALALLLERGQPGECYNVGSGRGTRVSEVVTLLEELTGLHPPHAALPHPAPPPDGPPARGEHSVADIGKLRAATGFAPRTPLRDTLRAMLDAADPAPPG